MFKVNEDYLKLPGSYLFSTIGKKVNAFAKENPDKQVVFLGVGFETTAPGTAAAALTAAEQRVENFSLWSMLKTVEPALRALMAMPDFNIDGTWPP